MSCGNTFCAGTTRRIQMRTDASADMEVIVRQRDSPLFPVGGRKKWQKSSLKHPGLQSMSELPISVNNAPKQLSSLKKTKLFVSLTLSF